MTCFISTCLEALDEHPDKFESVHLDMKQTTIYSKHFKVHIAIRWMDYPECMEAVFTRGPTNQCAVEGDYGWEGVAEQINIFMRSRNIPFLVRCQYDASTTDGTFELRQQLEDMKTPHCQEPTDYVLEQPSVQYDPYGGRASRIN